MASNMRKNHDAALKARVALEALKGEKTPYEIYVKERVSLQTKQAA